MNDTYKTNFDTDISDAMEKAVLSTLYDTYSITNNYNIYKLKKDDPINQPYFYSALKIKQTDGHENVMLLGFSKDIPNKVLENYGFHDIKDNSIINDCIEEISNIIYGKLKKILISSGYNVAINLPELVENKAEFENRYGSTNMENNAIFCIR